MMKTSSSGKGGPTVPHALLGRACLLPVAVLLIALLIVGSGVAGGGDDGWRTVVVRAADSSSGADSPSWMAQGLSVVADVADCTASSDGTARYFVKVRSSSGVDILNATGRLTGTGTENGGQAVNMFNGDLEAQADDGFPGGGCQPRPNDGHANDLGTTFVPSAPGTHTWSLRVLVAGYAPSAAIDLAPFVDGTVCPQGDGSGCLISLGTLVFTGVTMPSSSPAGTATPTPTRTTPFAAPSPPTVITPSVTPSPALVVRTPTATPEVIEEATPTPTGEVPSPSPLLPVPETTPQPQMCPDPESVPECGAQSDPESVPECGARSEPESVEE